MDTGLKRLRLIGNHLTAAKTAGAVMCPVRKTPNDVVIVSFSRTALCKATRGTFKDTATETLLATVLKSVVEQSKIDPKMIEDICVGSCLQPGAGATTSRMGQFLAGIPETTSLMAINRQCSSGLQAVMTIVNSIRGGQIDIGIGAGVESMSQYDFSKAFTPPFLSKNVDENKQACSCKLPMGFTSENVASRYGITREMQDKFAAESQRKAAQAMEEGLLEQEVTPMDTITIDKEGKETKVTAKKDEGVRKESTFESLSKLKPVSEKF